jgi:hypothetical protein
MTDNVGSRQFFSGVSTLPLSSSREAQGNGSERTLSVKRAPDAECNPVSHSHLHPEEAKGRHSSIAKPRH